MKKEQFLKIGLIISIIFLVFPVQSQEVVNDTIQNDTIAVQTTFEFSEPVIGYDNLFVHEQSVINALAANMIKNNTNSYLNGDTTYMAAMDVVINDFALLLNKHSKLFEKVINSKTVKIDTAIVAIQYDGELMTQQRFTERINRINQGVESGKLNEAVANEKLAELDAWKKLYLKYYKIAKGE